MNNVEQTKKQRENKAENKKAGKPFLILMAAAMAAGGIFGFFSLDIMEFLKNRNVTMDTISTGSIRIFAVGAPYAMWLLGIIIFLYTAFAIKKGKKEFGEYGFENEDILEKIDKSLNVGLFLTGSLLLVDYFLFSAHILAVVKDVYWNEIAFLTSTVGLIISMVLSIVLQQKIVDFVKEMNPEKRGSVYDVKFQNKWMDTCDEAEQLMVYRISYRAYKKVNALCLTLFILFFFLGMIFQTGLLPIAIVLGILLYSNVVYMMEAAKEGEKKQETN